MTITASVRGTEEGRAHPTPRNIWRRLGLALLVFLTTLAATLTVSAPPAAANTHRHLTIRATTVFGPPDYQPSQLTFRARGAIHTAGTWDLPEPTDEGDVSVVALTFRPSNSDDVFVIQVRSRRTVDVFDDQTCTGYATEAGSWTFVGGTGRYADLRGHGRLFAYASYFGVGDPQNDCAGISERFTLYLDGKVARQR